MVVNRIAAAFAALSLTAMPIAASAAPVSNPAQSLSIANARVGTPAAKKSSLFGGGTAGIFAILIVAGIAAVLIVDGTNGGDLPDSN